MLIHRVSDKIGRATMTVYSLNVGNHAYRIRTWREPKKFVQISLFHHVKHPKSYWA